MQSQTNSESSSFLFQSLRRLYFFAQIFGSASFSYSSDPEIGVHIKPINVVTFVLAAAFYSTICYLNATSELTIHASGYQAILFDAGLSNFLSYTPSMVWNLSFNLFISRKRIAKIMEKILDLDDEVRNEKKNHRHFNCFYSF